MKNIRLFVTLLLTFLYASSFSQSGISDPANPADIKAWRGKTVIYFAPHPDDELASSGTLALLTKNGNKVYVVVFCNGNAGSHDYEMSREKLAQIRKQEDINANGIVGIPKENIFFLGYDDGMLEYVPAQEIVERVCWFIRKYRPDAIFTLDPGDKHTIWHKTDHRASALLSVDGARAAAYHLVFPNHYIYEGLKGHTVRDWFFYESDGPILNGNYKVDITESADLKWKAACQHTSQIGKGNIKYSGTRMDTEDQELAKKWFIEKEPDGRVYENFRRLQESLSF